MHRMLLALWALVIAGSLSGCIDDGADGGQEDPVGGQEASPGVSSGPVHHAPEGSERSWVALAFAEGQASRSVIWSNGSFAAQQSWNPFGMATDTALGQSESFQYVEVTEAVRPGVPVSLSVSLAYEGADGTYLHPVVDQSEGDRTRQFYEEAAGRAEAEYVLRVPGGTQVWVGVMLMDPGAAAEVSYTLRVEVSNRPGLVPPRVPVGVTLERGGALFVEPAGEGVLSFELWAPSDEYLGLFETQEGVGLNVTSSGEYVIHLDRAAPWAGLSASLPERQPELLRVLEGEIVLTPTAMLQGPGSASVSFDVERKPLAMAARLVAPQGVAVDWQIQMVGPEGGLLVDEASGGTPHAAAETWRWSFDWEGERWSDPRLLPGSYEVAVQSQAALDVEVGGAVWTYLR